MSSTRMGSLWRVVRQDIFRLCPPRSRARGRRRRGNPRRGLGGRSGSFFPRGSHRRRRASTRSRNMHIRHHAIRHLRLRFGSGLRAQWELSTRWKRARRILRSSPPIPDSAEDNHRPGCTSGLRNANQPRAQIPSAVASCGPPGRRAAPPHARGWRSKGKSAPSILERVPVLGLDSLASPAPRLGPQGSSWRHNSGTPRQNSISESSVSIH